LWVVLALLVRVGAPSWQSLALDGDFDYLPADRPSVDELLKTVADVVDAEA